jgi:signal transduction histidine kinase
MQRILVIEDDEPWRMVVVATLKREGFEILEAKDGEQGLQMARSQMPDLIISDVYMPNLNGTDVLTTLRSESNTATIPFILMTCETGKVDMRVGMGLGADDYLAKPFPPRMLVEAVKIRLKRHQQIQERAEAKMENLRSTLSTTLPHELLTPLAGVLGYAEMIRLDFDTLRPGDIMEMTWGIEKCALRLQRLVQNYLLYADIELLGKKPEQLKSMAHNHTANSRKVVLKAARTCVLRHMRQDDFTSELTEAPLTMGENFLSKIVEELVDNACIYSPVHAPIKVATTSEAGCLVLKVTDQGRGMTPEQISDIGAFRQFDRQKYEQQGMGLGLFISRRLTELYQGKFVIHSAEGKGVTVEVRLPLKTAA